MEICIVEEKRRKKENQLEERKKKKLLNEPWHDIRLRLDGLNNEKANIADSFDDIDIFKGMQDAEGGLVI